MNCLVYTVVTKGYDVVEPIKEKFLRADTTFWLFTDDKQAIAPKGWKIFFEKRKKNEDGFTYNRRLKFGYNLEFEKFKFVIYIDGSVKIKKNLDKVIDWCTESEFNFSSPRHFLKHNLFEEILHINKLGKGRGDEMQFYEKKIKAFQRDNINVFENGIFIRKINKENLRAHIKFSNRVLSYLHNFKVRDQVVVPLVLNEIKQEIKEFPFSFRNWNSPFSLKLHKSEEESLNFLKKIKFWIKTNLKLYA